MEGSWQLAVGSWQLAVGSWQPEGWEIRSLTFPSSSYLLSHNLESLEAWIAATCDFSAGGKNLLQVFKSF
jgi:hypothetical protein